MELSRPHHRTCRRSTSWCNRSATTKDVGLIELIHFPLHKSVRNLVDVDSLPNQDGRCPHPRQYRHPHTVFLHRHILPQRILCRCVNIVLRSPSSIPHNIFVPLETHVIGLICWRLWRISSAWTASTAFRRHTTSRVIQVFVETGALS